ncbi:hypothetical protein FRX31_023502 [Thalictrum thalictroides]|uniref:DUF4218 domain-containing protein n=1 Tax=Thalictrum thalictroides TaxID=46969 RepID=A0A7J6VQ48_THATH|nr:hypothetical protein FRX31_023502 [Thalictrum thalictroides]
MYVFERYMKFLKGFVRNKAKPEGLIAKYEVKPYEQIHLNELKLQDENLVTNEGLLWKMHAESFSSWLKDKIMADESWFVGHIGYAGYC